MKFNIRSRGVEINIDTEKMLHHKFSVLDKLYNRIAGYDVLVNKIEADAENIYEIEGRVLIPKSSFFCRERGKSIEKVIDRIIENLTRQLNWKREDRKEIW